MVAPIYSKARSELAKALPWSEEGSERRLRSGLLETLSGGSTRPGSPGLFRCAVGALKLRERGDDEPESSQALGRR